MTGRTHRAIGTAGATGLCALGTLAGLPIAAAAVVVPVAVASSKLPDQTEWFGVDHRTWTHWLPTGLASAVLAGVLVSLIPEAAAIAAGSNGLPAERQLSGLLDTLGILTTIGMLIGWWLHSLADGLTDKGCWIHRRRRTVLLPDHLRIKVYTSTKHPLTGKVISKKPSAGDRAYRRAANIATLLIIGTYLTATHPTAEKLSSRGHTLLPR